MNIEKWEQDENPPSKSKFAFVLLLLLYLKIYLFSKKVSQSVKAKMLGHPNNLGEKEIFLRYLRQNISSITGACEGSEVSVRNVQRLKGTVNVTYFVELSVKRADGSSNVMRIVGSHLHIKGTYQRTASLLKLYGKRILQIRPICYPRERIKAELNCVQKMREIRVRMPDIIYVDLDHGYIFTKFIEGENVADIIHQIHRQKLIKNWQMKLFEEIGRGLAEMNLNLKIAHGDTFAGNWIYEKKSGSLFLTDWETAGSGDPAWDLAHLIYGTGEELGNDGETFVFFDKIFLAIIRGYEEVDVNKKVVERFSSYWLHHALSVSPRIHERIFQYQGVPLPRGFSVLRLLPTPFVNTPSYVTQKRHILNQLIFRLLRTCLTIRNILFLISGRTDPNVIIIGNSQAKHARAK